MGEKWRKNPKFKWAKILCKSWEQNCQKSLQIFKVVYNACKRMDSMRFSCEPTRTFENGNKYTRKKNTILKNVAWRLTWQIVIFLNDTTANLLRCGYFLTNEYMFFSPSNCSIPSVSNAAFQTTTTTITEKVNKMRKKIKWRCVVHFFSREREGNEEPKRKKKKITTANSG